MLRPRQIYMPSRGPMEIGSQVPVDEYYRYTPGGPVAPRPLFAETAQVGRTEPAGVGAGVDRPFSANALIQLAAMFGASDAFKNPLSEAGLATANLVERQAMQKAINNLVKALVQPQGQQQQLQPQPGVPGVTPQTQLGQYPVTQLGSLRPLQALS